MDFYTFRIYGSIAVILGCFIFLYPKLLHPLVSAMFGVVGSAKDKNMDDFVPPPLRNRNPQVGESRQDIPENIKRSMRHGPHPGMRAAAQEQSKQSKGSGRGMMGVILPMYAVGIVVYLIYTLCKVFNKKDDKNNRDRRSPTHQVPNKDLLREDDQYSEEEGSVSLQSCDQLINHLQDPDSEMDMRKLQQRLAETEAQMTKILTAMKTVQGKVDTVATDTEAPDVIPAAKSATPQAQHKTTTQHKQRTPQSNDSSAESTPDSESYEIINRSHDESNGEDKGTAAETIQSKTNESLETHEEEDKDELHQETEREADGESEEVEDVLMKDKTQSEADENLTVRKRIPKPDVDS